MTRDNTSSLTYLGVDPSANGTGLALKTIAPDGKELHFCTRIPPPKGVVGAERLYYIWSATLKFLEQADCTILTHTCIESASLYSNNRETTLSEVRGIFKLLSFMRSGGTEPIMIAPTRLKKFATGSGEATKDEIIQAIRSSGLWTPRNEDEADACVLANIAYCIDHHETAQMTRAQFEIVLQLLGNKKHKATYVIDKPAVLV